MLTSIGQALFSSSSTQYHVLGDYIQTPDGRGYRYGLAGGTTLVVGKLQQTAAEVTANENLSIAAAALGATQIVTTSTVTVTANQYAGGYANIDVTPGVGYTYRISNHAAATAAVLTINLEAADSIQVALTTSSKVDLVSHPYNGVIVNPTTATGSPVGVAVYPVVNAQYGWIQTYGPCAVLGDSGTTVGLGLAPSAAVAGAVKTMAATLCQVGYALMTFTDTRYNTAYLTIH